MPPELLAEGQQQYTAVKPGVIRDAAEGGKKVGHIKKGDEVVALEENGKRVRLTCVRTNETGWVTKTNTKGEPVLVPVGGDAPFEQEAGADKATAAKTGDKDAEKEARKEAKNAELRAKREASKKGGGKDKAGDGKKSSKKGAAADVNETDATIATEGYTAVKPGVMREEPKDGAKKVGQIRKGEEIVTLAEEGNFVRLTNTRSAVTGWVKKTNVKGEPVLVNPNAPAPEPEPAAVEPEPELLAYPGADSKPLLASPGADSEGGAATVGRKYKVAKPGVIRDKKDKGTKVGQLKKGDVVVALEGVGNKMRLEEGWVSKTTTKGEDVLVLIDDDDASDAAAGAAAAPALDKKAQKKAELKAKQEAKKAAAKKGKGKKGKEDAVAVAAANALADEDAEPEREPEPEPEVEPEPQGPPPGMTADGYLLLNESEMEHLEEELMAMDMSVMQKIGIAFQLPPDEVGDTVDSAYPKVAMWELFEENPDICAKLYEKRREAEWKQSAATRMQAAERGRVARKEVRATKDAIQAEKDAKVAARLHAKKEEQAAVAIQARARGRTVRNEKEIIARKLKEDKIARTAAAMKIQATVRGNKARDPSWGANEVEGFGDVSMRSDYLEGSRKTRGQTKVLDIRAKALAADIDGLGTDHLGDAHFSFANDGVVDKKMMEAFSHKVVMEVDEDSDFVKNGGVAVLIPSKKGGVVAEDQMLKLGGKMRKVWQERYFFLTWYGLGW